MLHCNRDPLSAGMDWLCPGYSEVLAKQLSYYHGNVTAANTIHDIVSIVQTGDLHVAIYDMAHDHLYVANARADSESGPAYAYERSALLHVHSISSSILYHSSQDIPAIEYHCSFCRTATFPF